jgi:hypothetical protein
MKIGRRLADSARAFQMFFNADCVRSIGTVSSPNFDLYISPGLDAWILIPPFFSLFMFPMETSGLHCCCFSRPAFNPDAGWTLLDDLCEPPVIPLTSHSASLSNEKLIQYCALIFSLLSLLFFFSKQRRKVCRLVNNQLLIKNICIECALKNWRKKEKKKTFIGNSISSLFPAIEWNLFPVKETRSELEVLERSR